MCIRDRVKGQGQTVKIVYTLPFEPVVRSRSILGLGLPSSASGNCELPLQVHWNCLSVSNQGAFNVSRVSGRSVLILFLELVLCTVSLLCGMYSYIIIVITAGYCNYI